MDPSRAESARVSDSYWFFFFLSGRRGKGGAGVGWFSDSCHPAPPTRRLRHLLWNHKPPFLPPMGRADCAHPCGQTQCAACASSASVLSVFSCSHNEPVRNHTAAVLRLTQLAHKQLICFTNQQGKLQVQGCSIDSEVKSMELIPPPLPVPHPVYIYMDILFWYWIYFLNN